MDGQHAADTFLLQMALEVREEQAPITEHVNQAVDGFVDVVTDAVVAAGNMVSEGYKNTTELAVQVAQDTLLLGLSAIEQVVDEMAAEVQAWVVQIQVAVSRLPSQTDAAMAAAGATLQDAVQAAVGGFLKLFRQLEAEVQNFAVVAPALILNVEKTLLTPAKEAVILAVGENFRLAVHLADAFAGTIRDAGDAAYALAVSQIPTVEGQREAVRKLLTLGIDQVASFETQFEQAISDVQAALGRALVGSESLVAQGRHREQFDWRKGRTEAEIGMQQRAHLVMWQLHHAVLSLIRDGFGVLLD